MFEDLYSNAAIGSPNYMFYCFMTAYILPDIELDEAIDSFKDENSKLQVKILCEQIEEFLRLGYPDSQKGAYICDVTLGVIEKDNFKEKLEYVCCKLNS